MRYLEFRFVSAGFLWFVRKKWLGLQVECFKKKELGLPILIETPFTKVFGTLEIFTRHLGPPFATRRLWSQWVPHLESQVFFRSKIGALFFCGMLK